MKIEDVLHRIEESGLEVNMVIPQLRDYEYHIYLQDNLVLKMENYLFILCTVEKRGAHRAIFWPEPRVYALLDGSANRLGVYYFSYRNLTGFNFFDRSKLNLLLSNLKKMVA